MHRDVMRVISVVISPAESAVWTVDIILARTPARVILPLATLEAGPRRRALTSEARLTLSWHPTSEGALHYTKVTLRRLAVNIEPPVTDKLVLKINNCQ